MRSFFCMLYFRFHGIFAPNSQYRSEIVNQKSNKKVPRQESQAENERRIAMTWAARLKRAFDIDIKVCYRCGGVVKVMACIEDPYVINQILNHLNLRRNNQMQLPLNRAPPVSSYEH